MLVKRALLILLVIVLLGTSTGRKIAAQGTPTPTETPVILVNDAEVLFPMAVRLGLTLNIAYDELKSGTVHIYQPGGIDVVESLPIADSVDYLNDHRSLVRYLWPINPEHSPAPFSALNYTWDIQTVDGRTGTAKGEFIFQDIRIPDSEPAVWQHTDGPLPLYSHNASLALNIVRTEVLRAYHNLEADTGFKSTDRFVLYDPGSEFCLRGTPEGNDHGLYIASRTIGHTRIPCDPTYAERIYRAHGFTLVRRPNFALDQLEASLIEIIANEAYDSLWQYSDKPPAWFRDGLIQLYGLTPHLASLVTARNAGRVNSLLPLESLTRPPEGDTETRQLWHAQSYLMVLYIASRFGAQAPFTLAVSLQDNLSFEGALTAFFQVDSSGLFDDWKRWVFSVTADSAVRWTVYLDSTPMPTPTATITPRFVPTANLPTPTRTPTVTRLPGSALGTRPVPTIPTNTALPPGQLVRPTPIPSPESESASSPDMALVGLLVLVSVLLLIGGFVFVALRRRPNV
jgi:hypothetical protein